MRVVDTLGPDASKARKYSNQFTPLSTTTSTQFSIMTLTRYHDPTEVELINPYDTEPGELEVIIHRYLSGETPGHLAEVYGVRAAVMASRIARAGFLRANTGKHNTMQDVLDSAGRFKVSS